MKTTFKLEGTDLAARKTAASLRLQLEGALNKSDYIELDFSEVYSASESFVDELLGVLVATHGLEWLFKHIEVRNSKPAVARSIAQAIQRRLEQTGDLSTSLLVAREELEKRQEDAHCH